VITKQILTREKEKDSPEALGNYIARENRKNSRETGKEGMARTGYDEGFLKTKDRNRKPPWEVGTMNGCTGRDRRKLKTWGCLIMKNG